MSDEKKAPPVSPYGKKFGTLGTTDHLERYKMNNRPAEERRALQSKGGTSRSPKKLASSMLNSPILRGRMTDEQRHVISLIKSGDYTTTIRDMIMIIASKADTADDWNKLLTQLLKLPFIEKVYQDAMRERKRDIIPIVVEVLREYDQDALIGVLYERLKKEGWDAPGGRPGAAPTLSPVRPLWKTDGTAGGGVEDTSNETQPTTVLPDMQPQDGDNQHDGERVEGRAENTDTTREA